MFLQFVPTSAWVLNKEADSSTLNSNYCIGVYEAHDWELLFVANVWAKHWKYWHWRVSSKTWEIKRCKARMLFKNVGRKKIKTKCRFCKIHSASILPASLWMPVTHLRILQFNIPRSKQSVAQAYMKEPHIFYLCSSKNYVFWWLCSCRIVKYRIKKYVLLLNVKLHHSQLDQV